MHYVYVLQSVRDRGFYIGYTSNLRTRLRQHSEGNSLATSHRGPWKLIYYEAYLEQADALGRKKYLKSGAGRRFLRSQLKNYLRKHRKKPRERSFYADLHARPQPSGNRSSPREITRSDLKVLLRLCLALAQRQSILRRVDEGFAYASAAA
jgi:putative endonuclease